jgi:hypothetical protein
MAKLSLPTVAVTTVHPIDGSRPMVTGLPDRGYARVALEMAGRAPVMSGQLVV